MGSDLKELVIRLRADASGYDSGVKKAQKDNEDLKKSSGGLGSGFKAGMGAALGFIGTQVGIASVGDAIGLVKTAFTSTIGAALDAQTTMAQTNAVLKSTHDASGQSAKSIEDFANAQMNLTGIDDQAVQGAENMIATFTNIKGAAFQPTTKAVLDMATAMNGGAIPSADQLRQTAIQVGKALNDPVQGVTALQRVGVKLSATQMEQVKHFMAVGDAADAQKVILGELNNEFGGSAKAAGDTFAGKLAIAQGQLQNVQETIGGAVLPILTQLMNKILPLAQQFAANLPNALKNVQSALTNLKPFMQWLGDHMDIVKIAVGLFAVVAGTLLVAAFISWATAAWAAATATIAATWPILAVIAVIALIVAAIIFLVSHWSQVSAFFGNIAGAIGGFFGNVFGAIGGFVGNVLGAIGRFIGGVVAWFQALPGRVWTWITTFATGLLLRVGQLELDGLKKIGEFIAGIIAFFAGLPGKVWTWIENTATGILLRVGQLELDGLKKIGEFIGGIISFFQSLPAKVIAFVENLRSLAISKFNDLKNGIGSALTGMKNTAASIWGSVVGIIKGAINTIIGDINGFIDAINRVSIHIPSIKVGPVSTPAFNWNGPGIPHIPYLAAGGIATRPTLAVVGDAGPEAIIPLSRFGNKGMGGNTYVTNVYPQQATIDTEALARIQRRRELLTGMRGA